MLGGYQVTLQNFKDEDLIFGGMGESHEGGEEEANDLLLEE